MTSTDWLVLSEGDRPARVVPIIGRLFVGRACAGADATPHLLLDDPAISRDHFELRADRTDGVVLVDRSTNGTRVNGRRLERDEPLTLTDGDFVEVGTIRMSFRSLAASDRISDDVRTAVRAIEQSHVSTVVGDIVGYTAMTERDGEDATAAAADELFAALADLLVARGAAASHRDGDSLFAVWDVTGDPAAADKAVRFALAAAELAGGMGLQMGWGVTLANAAPAHPTSARHSVDSDAINLAFRLSGLAARDGESVVLVSAEAASAASDAADYGDLREIAIRGRASPVAVYAAEAAG
ncbi:MAG TPA: FHA domain-containing protein [Solirubrobacteraceae bacterium]|nr:FHA domain-containing protein [Solirubrobacteraceae bacterium]